jgi:uncharacterized protein YggE
MKLKSKFITALGVIIPILMLGGIISAPANAAPQSRMITISATGSVKVTPDAVRINATVTKVATSNALALSEVGTSAAAVRKALLANGISTKDIKTQSLTVYPEFNYTQDKGSVLIGYRGSQSFEIVVRNAPNAGTVVDAIVATGSDNLQLNGVTPFVIDSTKAIASAQSVAVKNAKAKAASYAKLLGVKLGKVNYLIENSSPTYLGPLMAMDKASGSTVVDLGQQEVTVSITVSWYLL